MPTDFKGLENKLEGVHVGDFLLLEAENGDFVSGYLREFSATRVQLSHESPTNQNYYGNKYFPRLTIGNREYRLHDFEKYKVMNLNSTSE
ncbi:MAG: hypothetical protein U9Q69_01370 [Nanoarchaeota archaeon]|nr:hypothetical protein [Nanoarchaeota archaeon]